MVVIDAEVAASDAELVGVQIDLFKALGGGWDATGECAPHRPGVVGPCAPRM